MESKEYLRMNNNLINNNTENNYEERKRKLKKKRHIEEEQFRLVISKEVNDLLEKLVSRTNEGFEGGEVTKSDVANQIILNHGNTFSELDIKVLRNLHFDDKKVLRSLLKRAGEDVELPIEIKKILREHLGLSEPSKKRPQRPQTDLSTEKSVDN